MYYIQGNIIFHSTYTIFNKKFFSKYTDSYTKKYKLYNNLLNNISPETKLLVLGPSNKNRPIPVPILYTPISPTQNNPPTHFSLPSLSLSLLSSLVPKMPIVEIENVNDVDSDVEI